MIRHSLLILFLMSSLTGTGQVIATFEVNLPAATNDLEIPVNVSLKGISSFPDKSLSLVKVNGDQKMPVPFQVTPAMKE
ncbi:MAG: hypothetical protein WDO71_00655 [Bacteroidota bacterium]